MTITMNGKDYNGLMKYLKSGVSKDNTRPAMQLIHVFNDGNQVIFETCNGYMIKRQSFAATDDDPLNFDITVEVPPLKVLSKDTVTLEFLTTGLNLIVNGATYFIRSTEMEYINTHNVFNKPDEDVIEYGFTVDYLKKILDGYTGKIKMTIKTDNNLQAVFIEDLDDPEKISMLLPVRMKK